MSYFKGIIAEKEQPKAEQRGDQLGEFVPNMTNFPVIHPFHSGLFHIKN